MKAILLVLFALTAGTWAAEETFDPRIEAWAYGTVWGIDKENGVFSIQGQLSDTALKLSRRVAATMKDSSQHDAAEFDALQADMKKLAKREINVEFDRSAPLTVFQCPVKIPNERGTAAPKVVLTDLKIGDVVLIGYDAGAKRHALLAVVLIQNAEAVEKPPAGAGR